jgi:uncharacterized repeat protein (TIGR02543 family)
LKKLGSLVKNKQGLIALFVLLAMVFNACSDPAGVETTTPKYGYVDSNGNIAEKDSGRTVVVADKKAKAVFYSDNLASDAQRVAFAYEDKTMIFLFEKNQNFPTSIVLSGSGEPINGIFTPYNSGTQTYSLIVEQGGDQATLSNISLSKNIFTQYKDDPGFNTSQNLRMRNLHMAMCIYKSIDAFIASDNAHQARGFWSGVNKVLQVFFPGPITEIVVGAIGFYSEANSFMSTSNPFTMKDNISGLVESTNLIINGLNKLFPSSGSSSGGSTFVAVTNITGVPTSGMAGTPIALSGTVVPSNATSKTIVWSVKSAGTTGATISGNTLLTKAAGTVIVTATIDAAVPAGSGIFGDIPVFNPYTKDFYITITSAFVAVTGITGVPTGGIAGTPIVLSGTVAPDNATNKAITWSVKSAGTTGATINGNTLTTKASGTVTVTATIANGKTASTPYTQDFSITITNNFVAVTGITGVPTGGTSGTPIALSGTVAPDNATNKAITWSVKSAGTTGASISGNTLTTTAAGTVTVTATIANGKTASTPYTQDFTINITNTFVAVTGITGVPSTASVGAFDLAGTVAPANASNQIIVWTVKSSGTTGARINGNTLTTTAAGTVTVTGTIANGKVAGTPFTQDFVISITSIANTYTVTFNKNNTDTDSTEADPLTKTVTEPASRIDKLPTQPARKGYTFNGWNTQANGSGTPFTATTNVTSNTTVYAQWTGITYTVTFNKNNTDAGSTEANPLTRTVTVPATSISSLPTQPTRPGYAFNGWNTQANGSGTPFTATTNVTSNTTVYAQWMVNPINIAPADLSAGSAVYVDSETKTGRCNLSWSGIPGAAGYYIYRSLSASGTYDKIATITSGTYCSDYSMPAGKVYYYKVSAFNSLGEGPVSSYMPWIALATPENVRVYFEVVTSDKVLATVSWSPVPGATEYMVYWSYSANNGGMSGMSEFTTSKSHWFDRNTAGYFEIQAVAVFTDPYAQYNGYGYRVDFTLP